MNEQHDGMLGEDYSVRYDKVCVGMDHVTHKWKYVQGVLIDGVDDGASLTPQQALLLLAWLEQERETLEHMASETHINEQEPRKHFTQADIERILEPYKLKEV